MSDMQKTMKALVKARKGYGNMEVWDVPVPRTGDDDVLMRVWGSGSRHGMGRWEMTA